MYGATYGFYIIAFIMLKDFPSIPSLLSVFAIKDVKFCLIPFHIPHGYEGKNSKIFAKQSNNT